MNFKKKRIIVVISIITILVGVTVSQAQLQDIEQIFDTKISHNEIVNQGIQFVYNENSLEKPSLNIVYYLSLLPELEKWYNKHPMVEFASLIENTITIKFIDGSYTVLMDIFSLFNKHDVGNKEVSYDSTDVYSSTALDNAYGQTALILNPSEYLYGNRHCRKIINRLMNKDYNIVYLANEDVDLTYVKYNLGAEIVYMNTHAGYWDIDGDQQADAVVIGTGEYWTDATEYIHEFEYENQMIVEGMVGDKSFIAFTPALVEYYYNSSDLPNSLIYLATCFATYDDSMANAFLESGASAYVGWTQNTVYWTNSITSVLAFKLFVRGFTVKQVCRVIRSGGFYNFLLGSKLTYFGDGDYRISI